MIPNLGYRTSRFIPAGAGNSPSTLIAALVIPVYPRWRGELYCSAGVSPSPSGLSPLARGTRPLFSTSGKYRRFIPAGAGNSHFPCKMLHSWPVYPRWRGELAGVNAVILFDGGLSPLARGTLNDRKDAAKAMRFIPAGAGNSLKDYFDESEKSVYPRWRGEL